MENRIQQATSTLILTRWWAEFSGDHHSLVHSVWEHRPKEPPDQVADTYTKRKCR